VLTMVLELFGSAMASTMLGCPPWWRDLWLPYTGDNGGESVVWREASVKAPTT